MSILQHGDGSFVLLPLIAAPFTCRIFGTAHLETSKGRKIHEPECWMGRGSGEQLPIFNYRLKIGLVQ
jgi:hypothetical protein